MCLSRELMEGRTCALHFCYFSWLSITLARPGIGNSPFLNFDRWPRMDSIRQNYGESLLKSNGLGTGSWSQRKKLQHRSAMSVYATVYIPISMECCGMSIWVIIAIGNSNMVKIVLNTEWIHQLKQGNFINSQACLVSFYSKSLSCSFTVCA